MEKSSESSARTLNPNNGGQPKREEEKPKVVVIMGPTGSGKSRLAIDLATHFPIEIINADSMQVYQGLDVLTNKVPLHEQKGVPHHLLGTIGSNVEFTAKKFRDSAIPIISDILSRNCLPVIVGGTNYYIQVLVSSFLLDDSAEDMDEIYSRELPGNEQTDHRPDFQGDSCNYSFDLLKELDPVAANRIHPNNHRKINQYLTLYARSGVLPSKLYQGKAAEKRRLNQLQTLFGWNINYVDATESISSKSDECWAMQVVGPAVKIIRSFLNEDDRTECALDGENKTIINTVQRDLWTQYICKACGDRVLRGAYEWEQHKQGRGHRKRISKLRKSQSFSP